MTPAKVAAAVAQLIALGADPEQRMGGQTMLDYAKAACPAEVQQAVVDMRPIRGERRATV